MVSCDPTSSGSSTTSVKTMVQDLPAPCPDIPQFLWYGWWDGDNRVPRRHPEKALTAVQVRNINKPGRYADGNGLHLIVDPSGARRWVLRTVVHGRRRDIGLGGHRLVSLAEARARAAEYRKIARAGGDPLAEKYLEKWMRGHFLPLEMVFPRSAAVALP
jgi:hypothetical protein